VGISEMQDCGLHPLIHTRRELNLAQNVGDRQGIV